MRVLQKKTHLTRRRFGRLRKHAFIRVRVAVHHAYALHAQLV